MPDDGSSSNDTTGAGNDGASGTNQQTGGQGAAGGQGGASEDKTFTQEELDRAIEQRLARERKKYADYDDLKAKAKQADDAARANQTTEEKLAQLQKDIADRDAAAIQEKADLAAERLQAKLVRGGLTDEDATALVGTIDPLRLLEDGKPSTAEIDKLAKTLTKIGTRPSADPDQGARSGQAAPSMNQLIRAAAGRNSVS